MSWRIQRPNNQRRRQGPTRLFYSFAYAFQGLWQCVLREQNFRIHTVAAGLTLWLGRRFDFTSTQWGVLWLTIGLVLSLEAVNTALETAVDLSCPSPHPLAKLAKDCGAAAVLLGSVASLGVAVSLFGDLARWQSLFADLATSPLGPVGTLRLGLLVAAILVYVFADPSPEPQAGPEKQKKKYGRLPSHHI